MARHHSDSKVSFKPSSLIQVEKCEPDGLSEGNPRKSNPKAIDPLRQGRVSSIDASHIKQGSEANSLCSSALSILPHQNSNDSGVSSEIKLQSNSHNGNPNEEQK
jgi:hypothetical protein